MNPKYIKLIKYLEDESIERKDSWFFHGVMPTEEDELGTIKHLLTEGIKCSYLRHTPSNGGYNGKYYVSVSKLSDDKASSYKAFERLPILILDHIHPLKADKPAKFSKYMNTILPLRTSTFTDEYQAFLKVSPNKIVALAYNLYRLACSGYALEEEVLFLQELISYLDSTGLDLPIYDLTGNKSINKDKVRALKIY